MGLALVKGQLVASPLSAGVKTTEEGCVMCCGVTRAGDIIALCLSFPICEWSSDTPQLYHVKRGSQSKPRLAQWLSAKENQSDVAG